MRIKVKVKPNASKGEIVSVAENELIARVKSAPDRGQANAELIGLLAEFYHLPKKNIAIIHGQSTKTKLIEVNK